MKKFLKRALAGVAICGLSEREVRMSVGSAGLVNKVFPNTQFSTGNVSGTDPLTYTETNSFANSPFVGSATIQSVTTDMNGVTTITATVPTSFGNQTLSGTVMGNDAADILLNGTFNGQTAFVLLTNTPALQPDSNGMTNQTTSVRPESANIVYDPNATMNADAPCYAAGTLIRAERQGVTVDVPVEDLRVGDMAVTASGERRPIRWIGHRDTSCRNHPRPREVMPILIAAHAFGADRPARDLVVSPGHSICLDVLGEVLIAAMSLVNGSTIRQLDVDVVSYWHVELDTHDLLLAENLPAESYLDMENRGYFVESDVVSLHDLPDRAGPGATVTHADFCRPFHCDGALVDAIRQQSQRRAEALGWTDGVRIEPPRHRLTA